MLKTVKEPLYDGENNAIESSHVYRVRGRQFLETMNRIFQEHGEDVCLLPVSAGSAGGGVFQRKRSAPGDIVGVQIAPANEYRSELGVCNSLSQIALDQIIIDAGKNRIYAGAAITLEQLNQALDSHLGQQYKVLGADLTSYTYAQVGATFMTGGMGPQRRYFSDSVEMVALYDGESIREYAGDNLTALAGTYGWTGIVTAVCCRYCALPANEIAFAMPINNTAESLARLLAHFADHAYLKVTDGTLQSDLGDTDLILGIEHITADAMGPMLAADADSPIHRRARQLKENCEKADADGLVFVNGRSNQDIEGFLFSLVDDANADTPTISGIALEHTEIFNVADEMRAVREAVPAAARGQAPRGEYSFKGHTDANIRLDRQKTGMAMERLWQSNMRYVSAVRNCFAANDNVEGEILVYGHLNPYGVDPHNRITLASDSAPECESVKQQVTALTHQFMRELDQLCNDTGSRFIGGEKGAGSEFEIIEAFEDIGQIPADMRLKLERQQKQIQQTSEKFSWRALPVYLKN